ncbi:MAG TPA: hypothetical protein VHO69_08835 [Phototrophicaceae bacterium]|nr:hypothetical protein [Phototrophicaceae bacterium]
MVQKTLIAILVLLLAVVPTFAQDAEAIELPQTYEGDGVIFQYPEDLEMLGVGEGLSFGTEDLVFTVLTPTMAELIEFDNTVELAEGMDAMLELYNANLGEDAEPLTADEVETVELDDEREALVLPYTNETTNAGLLALVQSSDEIILGLDAYFSDLEVEEFSEEDTALYVAILTTLDTSDVEESMDVEIADAGDEEDTGEAVELPNTYEFPTGITFGYTDNWKIMSEDPLLVVLSPANDLEASFIQIFDLGAMFGGTDLGMEMMLQTYGSGAASTWGDTDFSVDKFEMTEINGYEAGIYTFEGTQNDSPATVYLVILNVGEGSYVSVQAYSVGTVPDYFLDDVIATSETVLAAE